ncbi:hypothetical protein BBK36DRAFT_1169085 [Trichoderma citrinoviride]|uniref:F-box domain-containing protein n=1 Tax=Trichoderma citrinoviride TaxID=58853 RepID=A0A2T4BAZ6_9HYPO|nr:hypothetical protein BBK36DRAFT_1169085 [Trichoderma citrinoviride]PTB66494.1 hypothetical protein BBK36DRAFT_1169085 [Trichoderma citrinoviride]
MTALLVCPTEILNFIFKCLPASSLHALCRISKGLRQVAEPLLYSGIELIWDTLRPPTIIALLCTLQLRPQLASLVKKLSLQSPYKVIPPSISTEGADLHGFVATILGINAPFLDLWIQESENRTMDAFVMLLLYFVRNITNLRLTGAFARENGLLDMMLRASLFANTADVLPLSHLSSVRSITAEIDNTVVLEWPTYTPNPSNITTLDLKVLREGHLGRILATRKNLKTLKWEWSWEPYQTDGINNHVINLHQITADLSFVQGTLESLQLSATVKLEHQDPRPRINGSLKCLEDVRNLRKLQVPQLGLEDLMPKNIRHLTINEDMSRLKEMITWQGRDLFNRLQQCFTLSLHRSNDQLLGDQLEDLLD